MSTPTTPANSTPAAEPHGFALKKRRRWPWIAGIAVVAVGAAAAITIPLLNPPTSANATEGATLVVATAEGNAAEQALVNFVAEEVAPEYGITVEFKGLADSNTINRAVSEGEIAGTVYQHKLWLSQVLEANPDFKETAAVPVFRWGFGLWSDKYTSVDQVPDGGTVSLYSDPANEAQGLWLLKEAGLITLKEGTTPGTATQDDIATNPKNLKFKELESALLPRVLKEVDLDMINTNYALEAKLNPTKDALVIEGADSPYVNFLVAREDNKNSDAIQKLAKALTSPEVKAFIEKKYNGAVLPAF